MTPDEILYDFGRDDIFPKAAMAAASAKRETMTPIFIEMIDRLAELDIESIDEPSLMALIHGAVRQVPPPCIGRPCSRARPP